MLKRGIKKLSLNLKLVKSSEAADRLAHWITHTHTHMTKKRFGNSYRCPKARLSVYNDSGSSCVLRN